MEAPEHQFIDLRRRIAMIEERMAGPRAEVPAEPSGEELSDILGNAAAFQRDLFRIEDGRLAGTDSQAAILIAAAVAIITFTGGLVKTGQVRINSLVATAILAILVSVVALYARRERPSAVGKAGNEMRTTGSRARDAVENMYDLVRDGRIPDSASLARAEYDSWYALSKSINARRRVKSAWYFVAVVLLLLEVGTAIYTALGLNPST